MALKHYVEYWFLGYAQMGSRECNRSEEVVSRSPEKLDMSESIFAYRFFDRVDGGKPENYSPYTYFGQKFEVNEIKAMYPGKTDLISDMENGGYTYAVRTRRGNWKVLKEGDTVVNV